MHLRGRMLCSMDAMDSIFGFQKYPASFPSVTLIKIKLPAHLDQLEHEGKLCDLTVYFNRHESLVDLKYTEFLRYYMYADKVPARCNGGADVFELILPYQLCKDKRYYVFPRAKPEQSIVRMGRVYLSAGIAI